MIANSISTEYIIGRAARSCRSVAAAAAARSFRSLRAGAGVGAWAVAVIKSLEGVVNMSLEGC